MGIIEQIRDAGVVGCGGAGFPTHRKIADKIDYYIVNAAECEPLLRTDRYLMLNKAPDLVRALTALTQELDIGHCVIAVKHHYHDEIASLRKAIAQTNAPIEIHEMDSFYPAGDEQTIAYEVTGRVVPPAGIPMAVGAVINNVATVYAISQAMDGVPFTQKYLTVTGEVRNPTILCVPIGTSFQECIELAGGALQKEYFIVAGGPMMGRPMTMEQAAQATVTKTTSGILVLPADGQHARTNEVDMAFMIGRARSVCMQCSSCTQMCPRNQLGHPLEPHSIMRAMAMGGGNIKALLDIPAVRNAQLCCECGICEIYACPMGLHPRKINSMLKRELGAAGIRYQAPQQEWKARPTRELRKAPSDRVAARAGVLKYNDYVIRDLKTAEPTRVSIPVRMHIGAPAEPVVSVGDKVKAGDLIAKVPEGALGAPVHASISGKVESVGENIVIVKRR